MTRTLRWVAATLGVAGLIGAGCGADAPDALPATTATTVAVTDAPTTAAPATTTATTAAPATTDEATTDEAATEAPTTDEPTTDEPGTTTASTSSTTPAVTTTPVALAKANTVPVGLAEYSITLPDSIPSGPTEFDALNGGKEEHQMTIVKLGKNETVGDALSQLSDDPAKALENNDLVGGPQSIAPGGGQSATVDLQPGDYLALCVIPDSDGIPHAAKGMVKPFTVTGKADTTPIAPTATGIVLKDYGFTVADGFDGDGLYRVENQGTLAHELGIYRVADGKTYQDAEDFLMATTPPAGVPPIIPSGGLTPISPGGVAGTELHLTKGTYVFVCFLPGEDHMSHLQHGMIREVDIS